MILSPTIVPRNGVPTPPLLPAQRLDMITRMARLLEHSPRFLKTVRWMTKAQLITIPAVGGDGFIQGQYPSFLVHSGDRFRTILLCTVNATKCSVTFELLYKVNGTDTVTSLGTWDKVYDNSYLPVDIDLSALDGQTVIFFLKVTSKSDSTDDFAQWMAARITHP